MAAKWWPGYPWREHETRLNIRFLCNGDARIVHELLADPYWLSDVLKQHLEPHVGECEVAAMPTDRTPTGWS